MAYAKAYVKEATPIFVLKPALNAFKAARYISPAKCSEMKPTVTEIDPLQISPCLDLTTALSMDWSQDSAAEDVSAQIHPIYWPSSFWAQQESSISIFCSIVSAKSTCRNYCGVAFPVAKLTSL